MVYCLAKANNKYMGRRFNPQEPSTYLQYLDANNLYDWAMCQLLRIGGFSWSKDFQCFIPKKISDLVKYSKKEYLLEVDVSYSPDLHNQHNNLLSMLEKMKINGVKKLAPNLSPKR